MSTHQPAFTAYTITKRGEGQEDFWIAIGAAFMHQDGDGYNVVLQALPIDGRVVLRLPKKSASEDHAGEQRAIREENDRRRQTRK